MTHSNESDLKLFFFFLIKHALVLKPESSPHPKHFFPETDSINNTPASLCEFHNTSDRLHSKEKSMRWHMLYTPFNWQQWCVCLKFLEFLKEKVLAVILWGCYNLSFTHNTQSPLLFVWTRPSSKIGFFWKECGRAIKYFCSLACCFVFHPI